MFKVMIVDDEPEIVRHIRSSIDWSGLDLLPVGEAADADTALDIFYLNNPDIVLLDIRLPGKDGLSLARELVEQNPQIMIVIISSYQDFSYAKRALTIGVEDYLTKPVNTMELNEALRRMTEKHIMKCDDKKRLSAATQLMEQNKEWLRQWQLSSLVRGDTVQDEEQLRQQLLLLGVKLDGDYNRVIKLCTVNEVPENRLGSSAVMQYVQAKLDETGYTAYGFLDDNTVVFVLNSTEIIPDEKIKPFFLNLCSEMSLYFGEPASVGIGEPVRSLMDIECSASQAEAALHQAMLASEGDKLNVSSESSCNIKKIIECINDCAVNELKKQTEMQCRLLNTVSERQKFAAEFMGRAFKSFDGHGLSLWNEIDYPTVLRRLFAAESSGEYEAIFTGLCIKMAEIAEQQKNDSSRFIIEKAKEYVENNYSDGELSLDRISDYVGLSKSYFCSLFHSVEKTTFLTYLMNRRIREAKLLLSTTDKKIYEISCQVGCTDSAYFNRVFKREVGMTPLQYRNSNKQSTSSL